MRSLWLGWFAIGTILNIHNLLMRSVSLSEYFCNNGYIALRKRYLTMTVLHWRGVPYCKEDQHSRYMKWWQLVHRATLWLRYRGIKYRPCALETVKAYQK
jgi:hypothetical protein